MCSSFFAPVHRLRFLERKLDEGEMDTASIICFRCERAYTSLTVVPGLGRIIEIQAISISPSAVLNLSNLDKREHETGARREVVNLSFWRIGIAVR